VYITVGQYTKASIDSTCQGGRSALEADILSMHGDRSGEMLFLRTRCHSFGEGQRINAGDALQMVGEDLMNRLFMQI
jgi:hypothetical protein